MAPWPPARGPSGEARDAAAGQRDAAAEERDRKAAERDVAAGRRDGAADRRKRAADDGAADRAAAARDRRASALDRARAAADRQASSEDRSSSAADRAAAVLDGLTGAHRRDPGLIQLERDVVQAKRTKQPLTVAFVDVNGLKAKNDTEGHAAGDRMLADVATLIRSTIREYDVLVRYGGDEFVCGLLGLDRASAAKRFADASSAAGAGGQVSPISVGLAEMRPEDTLAELISRADADMYQRRQRT